MREDQTLILASGSRARREMLKSSGVSFTVEAANVDEDAVRAALAGADRSNELDPADVAEVLARSKAEAVSQSRPNACVIGGDQVLALDDEILTKPADEAAARRQLQKLKGRVHALHSAVALAIDGEVVWSHVETAQMHVRDFSDAFLDDYMRRAGRLVLGSVGAYHMEGLGIQLFDRIDGDYFTVLGMPLMPLLAELRARHVIMA